MKHDKNCMVDSLNTRKLTSQILPWTIFTPVFAIILFRNSYGIKLENYHIPTFDFLWKGA